MKDQLFLVWSQLPYTHHNNVVNKVLALWNDFVNINNRNSVSFPEPHDRLMF